MISFYIGSDGDRWVEAECPVCGIDMDYEPEEFPAKGDHWMCPLAPGGCSGQQIVPKHEYRRLFAPEG